MKESFSPISEFTFHPAIHVQEPNSTKAWFVLGEIQLTYNITVNI